MFVTQRSEITTNVYAAGTGLGGIAGAAELIFAVKARHAAVRATREGDCLITRCGALPRPHRVSAISAG